MTRTTETGTEDEDGISYLFANLVSHELTDIGVKLKCISCGEWTTTVTWFTDHADTLKRSPGSGAIVWQRSIAICHSCYKARTL